MKSFITICVRRPLSCTYYPAFFPLLLLISILLVACGETSPTVSSTATLTKAAVAGTAGAFNAGNATTVAAATTSAAGASGAGNATTVAAVTPPTGANVPTTAAAQVSKPPTPNSTATADLPNLVYPGSREAIASDATAQQVLKSASGSDPTLGDFTAKKLLVYFTAEDLTKIEAYYKKAFTDAGYQTNNQVSGQGNAVYVFQKNGVKVVLNFGALGPTITNLPPEFQTVAKPNDNLILAVTGSSVVEPTAVPLPPTPVNIPGTPLVPLAAGQKKIATITLENGGSITMELYPDIAPVTVENFEKLANRGFYDGLTFHRIVAGFVVQGGDPNGDGSGGPGTGRDAANTKPYNIPGEFTTKLQHDFGTLAMARAADSNSGGSQFYIVTGKAGDPSVDGLNGKYAIFGKVTSDMNIVLQIKQGDKMKTVRVENK